MALNIPAGLKIVMSDGAGRVLDVDAPLTKEEIALPFEEFLARVVQPAAAILHAQFQELPCYVPAELARQLERENDRLRRQVKELAQEISATAREAFSEGQWSARQGDDYGSY